MSQRIGTDAGGVGADAKRLSAAMGDHLASFEWDFIVTLTTDDNNRRGRRQRRPVAETELRGEVRRFLRRVAGSVGRPIAYAVSYQSVGGGHAHAHALLGVCGDAAPAAVRRAWKAGISDVTRYDVTRAGAYYVSRFAGADPDSMDVSITMPPRLDGAVYLDASDADGNRVEATGASMLALMRPEPKGEPIVGRPIVIERADTLEVIDLDHWGHTMARIILRRAGIAA